ncbi:MAG: hypothetical protein VX346_10820, partial [Planctomycetota bacterium]|nr:hypothetical protein [Planctomycetota bacterium]
LTPAGQRPVQPIAGDRPPYKALPLFMFGQRIRLGRFPLFILELRAHFPLLIEQAANVLCGPRKAGQVCHGLPALLYKEEECLR